MSEAAIAQWRKLEERRLDHAEGTAAFVRRLVRENAWSPEYAARVTGEYKRFLWLAVVAGHPVTPSDAVDQAWHLHIVDTLEYRRFCEEIFGKCVEHTPSRGGPCERAKFEAQYLRTLSTYRNVFGEEPPPDIWPDVDRRFAEALGYVRVNRAERWLVRKPIWWSKLVASRVVRDLTRPRVLIATGALFALGWGTGGAHAASLSGSAFVVVYVLFWAGCLAVALRVRRGVRRSGDEQFPELDAYELAELAEPGRALDAAVAVLLAAGGVSFDSATRVLRAVGPVPPGAHAFEQRIHQELVRAGALTVGELSLRVRDFQARLSDRLREVGLSQHPVSAWPFWFALAAPVLAGARIVSSVATGRPIFVPVLLCVLGTVVAFAFFRDSPVRTVCGDDCLERWRRERSTLRDKVDQGGRTLGDLSLSVGLFGLGAVDMPALADWVGERAPAEPAPGAATEGGDAGDGDAGAGDAGGCGGGCGGCGGCGGGCG